MDLWVVVCSRPLGAWVIVRNSLVVLEAGRTKVTQKLLLPSLESAADERLLMKLQATLGGRTISLVEQKSIF